MVAETAVIFDIIYDLVAGGELVDRLGVGVDEGAHLEAPSSLSGLPAGAGLSGAYHAGRGRRYSGAERRMTASSTYPGVERRLS